MSKWILRKSHFLLAQELPFEIAHETWFSGAGEAEHSRRAPFDFDDRPAPENNPPERPDIAGYHHKGISAPAAVKPPKQVVTVGFDRCVQGVLDLFDEALSWIQIGQKDGVP